MLKETPDDLRKSDDLNQCGNRTKCEIPSLKFERKPSNLGYETVMNSITDRERKPIKSKVNTSFKSKRVIGGSTTSRKIALETQKLRASLNGLRKTATEQKQTPNLVLSEE